MHGLEVIGTADQLGGIGGKCGRDRRSSWCRQTDQRRVLVEDSLLEHLEGWRGFDSEVLAENPARLLVGTERLSLAPGAVEGEHLQPSELLAIRHRFDQNLELAQGFLVSAELEQRSQSRDPGLLVELLEPGTLPYESQLICEISVRDLPAT